MSKLKPAAKAIGFAAILAGPPLAAKASGVDLLTNTEALVLTIGYETLVIVVTAAMTILKVLRERWVDELANLSDKKIRLLISTYRRTYLGYQRAAHGYMDLTGLTTRGDYTLSLPEIFLDLRLEPNPAHALNTNLTRAPNPSKSSPSASNIWAWIRESQYRHTPLVIVGPPGSGKTTLLKHVALVLASKERPSPKPKGHRKLPVILFLRDYKDDFAKKQDISLTKLIRKAISKVPAKEPPDWVEQNLRLGRFLIMLDGMDEVPQAKSRENLATWIERQRATYPDTFFVLTSRPLGYYQNPLPVSTTLQVAPFSFADIDTFITKWYQVTQARSHGANNASAKLAAANGSQDLIRRLKSASYIHELAVNPLLLTMIANVHHYRGALPGSRADLYREICDVLLGKRHQARGVETSLSSGQWQIVLEELALLMMNARTRDITVPAASRVLSRAVKRVAPRMSPDDFLQKAEESSGLILEREAGIYSFAHLTIQEYLAASYLSRQSTIENLQEKVVDSWWQEVLRLYSSQGDATQIISACTDPDVFSRMTLALAISCLVEAREVLPAIREQFQLLMNPGPDAGLDALLNAGLIRILSRSTGFDIPLDSGFLSSLPLTNYEYLFYLHDQTGHVTTQPVSWSERRFPPGTGADAASVPNYRDVVPFYKWFNSQMSDGWNYRPPFTRELSAIDGSLLKVDFRSFRG